MPKPRQQLRESEWRYRNPQPRPTERPMSEDDIRSFGYGRSEAPPKRVTLDDIFNAPGNFLSQVARRHGLLPQQSYVRPGYVPQNRTVSASTHAPAKRRDTPERVAPSAKVEQPELDPDIAFIIGRRKKDVQTITPLSKPEEIADLQNMLAAAGFDPGEIDGKFGKRTRAAVMQFQKANGLKVDGKVGMRTLGKLSSAIPYQAPNHQAGQAWQAQYPGNEAWAEYEGEEARLPRARPGPGAQGVGQRDRMTFLPSLSE